MIILILKPRLFAYSSSKLMRLKALKKIAIQTVLIIAITENIITSCSVILAAFPNKKLSNPLCAALPLCCILVSSTMPIPKNTLNVNARIVSGFNLDLL